LNTTEKAKKLYEESIVMDGHFAIELAMPGSLEYKWQLVDTYHAAGVTSVSLSLANDESKQEETLGYLALIRKHIFSHPQKYILAMTPDDILKAKRENKLAIRLMFQGAAPLAMNVNLVELYFQLGISSMVIAYNIRTPMGDGCIEEVDAGISHLGKQLVQQMNEVGMIIDGAHSSMNTLMGAIQSSKHPCIVSHACAYGVNPIPRNIRDEQIRAIAQSGGLLGINGIGLLLGDKKASIKKYVDHIDYVTNLVGASHVGIGLDHFYFGDQFSEFMKNQPITNPAAYGKMADPSMFTCIKPSQLVDVVEELLIREYSEEAIKAILGGNMLRVIDKNINPNI
jgi:membrane dipeptidase